MKQHGSLMIGFLTGFRKEICVLMASVIFLYFSINEYVINSQEHNYHRNSEINAFQPAFRTRFQIPPRNKVSKIPDHKSILLWVKNFKETGSVVKKRDGRPRSARTPGNINAVSVSVFSLLGDQLANMQPPFKYLIVVFAESYTWIFISIRIRWLLCMNYHSVIGKVVGKRVKKLRKCSTRHRCFFQ